MITRKGVGRLFLASWKLTWADCLSSSPKLTKAKAKNYEWQEGSLFLNLSCHIAPEEKKRRKRKEKKKENAMKWKGKEKRKEKYAGEGKGNKV